MNLRGYITSLIATMLFCAVNAQKSNFFYHLTTANGLSSNYTASVIQDKEGYYWIATSDGLNRFDGSTCTIFRNDENDEQSLSHNNCIFLLEDDYGDIWIATQGGINRFNKKSKKFARFYLEEKGIPFEQLNWIRGLVKDKNGDIYVSSNGLWKYDIRKMKWSSNLYGKTNTEFPAAGIISSLQYDSVHNKIWMNSERGILSFDIATNKFQDAGYNPDGFTIFNASCENEAIAVDKYGLVWFKECKTGKLSSFDTKTNRIILSPYTIAKGFFRLSTDDLSRIWIHYWSAPTTVYDPLKKTGDDSFLKHCHIRSSVDSIAYDLHIDKDKNYWISTKRGVSIYNERMQFVQYHVLTDRKEAQTVSIKCVIEENHDKLLVGTARGLYRYDTQNEVFEKLHSTDRPVRCLSLMRNNYLWFAVGNEIFSFNLSNKRLQKKIVVPGYVQFIRKAPENKVWVGTWQDGLYLMSEEMVITHKFRQGNNPHDLYSNTLVGMSDVNQDFWLGYNGGNGFSKYDANTGTWAHYKVHSNQSSKNSSNTVSCITQDITQKIWLGTSGGGVVRFDPNGNNFELYTQNDGLRGAYINSILSDGKERLWVSTNNGLSVIDTKTGQITNPDVDVSMPNNNFVSNGLVRNNGHLVFFAGNTITEVDPDAFFNDSKPSKILIGSFKVFNEELSLEGVHTKYLKLNHDQNFFSIEYSLLKAFPTVPVQYAYQLKGFDKEWNYVNDRRIAYYTNVPGGEYSFQVKATDASGKWVYFSDPLVISVVPPVWLRTWFLIVSFGLLLFIMFAAYRYRIGQLRKVYRLRSGISQDLHDEVASTLSGIRLYSEMAKEQLQTKNTEQAYKSLQIISENSVNMMQGMNDIVWTINPSNDTFSMLLQKLKAYAIQITHPAKIVFTMNVDESIPAEKLNMEQRRNIYLICKEAVNNAVKYSSASQLEVNVRRVDSSTEITIEDNGIGFTDSIVKGTGLLNMEKRSKEIGAHLLVESNKGKGTRITIKIKIIKK